MCGVAAILDHAGAPVERAWLARMASVQAHRGPDGAGCAFDAAGRVGLAHVRLAIRDAEGGAQPMWCARGRLVVSFNGEIYDADPLRRRLAEGGFAFRTRSDTELLLAAYDRWGEDCPAHLNGEFAFVIWDEARQTLFAARDAAGVKPLFWHEGGGRLCLASEAKGLLVLPWVERAISRDYLCGPFLGVYPRAVSAFACVNSLAPGDSLTAAPGKPVRIRTWWAPRPVAVQPMTLDDARALVRAEVSAAVERRLDADVPVHAYVSGGVDSTIVCGLLARARRGVTAFHIAFDDPRLDEAARAREVARAHGVGFEAIRFGPAELAEGVEHAVWHTELGLANPNSVARLALSGLARRTGARVVLSGEGADERFGGYAYFKLEALWRRWQGATGAEADACAAQWRAFQAAEQPSKGLSWVPGTAWRRSPRTFGYASFHELRALRVGGLHRWLLDPGPLPFTAADDPAARFYADLDADRLRAMHPLHAARVIADRQLSGYILPNLGDRVEMANGVEARTPFLDTRLREVVDAIPPELHLDPATLREKRLLHEAFADLIPPSATPIHKHPFLAPGWAEVAHTPAGRDLFDRHLSPDALRRTGIFRVLPLTALRTLWPWTPRGSNLRKQLDILMGSALSVQILHARFVAQAPASDPEFPLPERTASA